MTRLAMIHVAGIANGGVQRCVRCGRVIDDSRGAVAEVRQGAEPGSLVTGMPTWPHGAEVLICEGYGVVVSALRFDRDRSDEVPCG